jgi:hypothetical protein
MPLPSAGGRTLTAIVALALGVLAVTGGINAIRFDIERKSAAGAASGATLAVWTNRTGLKTLALEATLRQPEADAAMEALYRRHDTLIQLLAAKPLAAQAWIALAAVRQSLAMPQAGIDRAFMMSGLAGPAEGDAMAQRALLGVLLWETSAGGTRTRALTDLCGLTIDDPSRLKLVLSTKTEGVRAAIRGGLLDHACAPRMIAAIGL